MEYDFYCHLTSFVFFSIAKDLMDSKVESPWKEI